MSLVPMPPAESSTIMGLRPLLLITEGVLDIACLTRLSWIVRSLDTELPDLPSLVEQGRVIFLPAGGGDLAAWIRRLAPLGCSEFHLYDKEQIPETELRRQIVAEVNRRRHCRAFLTRKRSLENYLHPQAVAAVCGVTIDLTDDTPVAEAVVQAQPEWQAAWPTLPYRTRQRLIFRTKRRLNTLAVDQMTAELLAQRDPAGEVLGWFYTIHELLAPNPLSLSLSLLLMPRNTP